MTQHYTRNTVWIMAYCGKCAKSTPHRVDGVRKGPCLDCIQKLEAQHAEKKPEAAKQESLFA
jgi:ribosomal protein L44E